MTAPSSSMRAFGPVDPQIVRSIREASRATDVDFGFLMTQAAQESGFRPGARSGTSSAAGLFQFIDSTWLDLVRRHGPQHGLAAFAREITLDAKGRPTVADPGMRDRILALRQDPKAAAALAAEYARDNRERVEQALGREIGATGLYLAHFLGPAGATEFLRAADHDGSTPAANVLPAAAAANRSVFYDGAGEPRTVAEIYRRFSEKFAAADSPAADASPSITAATAPRDVGRASPRATFAPLLTGPLLATLDAIAFSALRLLGGERETRTDESHRAS